MPRLHRVCGVVALGLFTLSVGCSTGPASGSQPGKEKIEKIETKLGESSVPKTPTPSKAQDKSGTIMGKGGAEKTNPKR